MHIMIINGSPRKNGATAGILRLLERELCKREDVAAEYIDIGDLTIAPCKGCCVCYRTGACPMKDDAEELSRKMEQADGLIIGSPTYASNVSGQLKTLIDRGHFVIEQLLYGKYAVSVATGENYGSRDTSRTLSKLLSYSGARISGKMICNLPFNAKPENNPKLARRAKKLADRFYRDVKGKKPYPLQTLTHKIIFFVGIKPFVRKKGAAYQGVREKWERHGIEGETEWNT